MDANHIHAEAGDGWRRGLLVSLQSCGTVQYKSACHKCLLLGATDRIEKQIYFVAIKVFLCHLHSNRHVYAERLKEGRWGETGWRGGVGVTLGRGDRGESFSHTTFLRQNGVACTRPKKDDGKKRFCCRSFPYVVSKMGRWGEGCSFRSHMAQNKQIKHKTWWGGELWLFQPPKVHAAQDEAKNGRSGSILAWMMDDGWWGGRQRNDKSDNNKRKANENWKQPQQQNKESKISPHPTLPGPKGKQKEDKNERKEKQNHKPSSWVQIDTEERCSYVHHTRKKGKETQHHVIQLFIRLEAEGEVGARNEDMNFCVHMMGCTVCLRKCVYVATIWGEGTVFSQQKLLALHLTALSLFFFFENTWVWGFNGLKRYKNK